MTIRATLCTAAAASLLCVGVSAQASYNPIAGGQKAHDISADGSRVVGEGYTTTFEAYYWDWQTEPSPTFIGGIWAEAVSADGSTILGVIEDPGSPTGQDSAAIWTQAAGWQVLGVLGPGCDASRSTASDISDDGNAATGLVWVSGCDARGFLWTQGGGMTALDSLGNGTNRANAIAGDGSIIAGFAQGNFSRTPCFWFPDGTGQVIDMDALGQFEAISRDGGTIYGSFNGDAVAYDVLTDTITVLGAGAANPDPWIGRPQGVNTPCASADTTVVGRDIQGLGSDAWIWRQSSGIQRLNDVMTTAGVLGLPALNRAMAISEDGSVVVGWNDFGDGWVIELPVGIAEVYSGCGGNPAGSLSVLCGTPTLGHTMVIGLDNPLGSMSPGALSRLTFSLAPIANPCGFNLPGYGMAFNGAIGELLITLPKIITISGAPWDGSNPAAVPVAIPTNTPLLGVTVYAQGALVDVSGGVHIGLTEAISLTFGQ